MKKLLLITPLLFVLTSSSFAQPQKGDWMLGANVTPFRFKAAKFLSNRFSLGLDINPGFSHHISNMTTGFNFLFLPTARYYFVSYEGLKEKKFAFFTDVNAGGNFNYTKDGRNNTSATGTSFQAGIAPGLIYMINGNVSVDAAIRMNYYNNRPVNSSWVGTTTEFGIQVYLPGRKAKKTAAE